MQQSRIHGCGESLHEQTEFRNGVRTVFTDNGQDSGESHTERSTGKAKGGDYRTKDYGTKVFCSPWIVRRKWVLHDACIVQHQVCRHEG
jgi:hypothetical protein